MCARAFLYLERNRYRIEEKAKVFELKKVNKKNSRIRKSSRKKVYKAVERERERDDLAKYKNEAEKEFKRKRKHRIEWEKEEKYFLLFLFLLLYFLVLFVGLTIYACHLVDLFLLNTITSKSCFCFYLYFFLLPLFYINLVFVHFSSYLFVLSLNLSSTPPCPYLNFTNKAECQIPNKFVLDQS